MVKGWTLEANSSLNMNVKVCPANDMACTPGCIALPDMLNISQLVMSGLAGQVRCSINHISTSLHLAAFAHLIISSSPSIACLEHGILHAH